MEGCCRVLGNRDGHPASDPERRRCPIPKSVLACFHGMLDLANSSHTDLSSGWDPSSGAPSSFAASPCMEPTADICYRTMPQTPRDGRLWPDLRLSESDASVRELAVLVAWFERLDCNMCRPMLLPLRFTRLSSRIASLHHRPWTPSGDSLRTKMSVSKQSAPF